MSAFHHELRQARQIVRAAGSRFLQEIENGVDVNRKGEDDVVTNIDLLVEKLLREEIRRAFPEDALVGEELGGASHSGRQWLIDPVDGTLNLARGVPLSSVSLALQVHEQSVVGVVYDPYRDEIFSAERGAGVWLNDTPIRVSSVQNVHEALIAAKPAAASRSEFMALARVGRDMRRLGTAALELAYVAAGRFDAFFEVGLKPWDTAAGGLLVEEAGGRISDAEGNVFTSGANSTLATNGLLHERVISALKSE